MQDFKKIRVWHAAQQLALDVHACMDSKKFARYPGKRSQTFRCADSIASNIAEGSAKDGREFARFLDMSLASTTELESHLLFAGKAQLIPWDQQRRLMESVEHVRRMLINLIRRVREDLDGQAPAS